MNSGQMFYVIVDVLRHYFDVLSNINSHSQGLNFGDICANVF